METVKKYKDVYKDFYYDSLYDTVQLGSLDDYKFSEENIASIYISTLSMKAVFCYRTFVLVYKSLWFPKSNEPHYESSLPWKPQILDMKNIYLWTLSYK
jgi:hypothetical protein